MMTPDEIIAVVQGFKDGKEIETRVFGDTWDKTNNPLWNFHKQEYRIAPTPTLRPWKPEEVPVGSVLRNTPGNYYFRSIIRTVTSSGVWCDESCNSKSFEELTQECFEHSIDNGRTWLPCGVMEDKP